MNQTKLKIIVSRFLVYVWADTGRLQEQPQNGDEMQSVNLFLLPW